MLNTQKLLWSTSLGAMLACPDYATVGVGLCSYPSASHVQKGERSLAPVCQPKRRLSDVSSSDRATPTSHNWFERGSLLVIGSFARPEDRREPQPHFYLATRGPLVSI